MRYAILKDVNFDKFIDGIKGSEKITLDCETTGLYPYQGDLPFMLQVKLDDRKVVIVNLLPSKLCKGLLLNNDKDRLNTLFLALKKHIQNKKKYIIGHNLKFDMHHLDKYFIKELGKELFDYSLNCKCYCTEAMAKLVDNTIFNAQLATCAKAANLPVQKSDIVKEYINSNRKTCKVLKTDLFTEETYYDDRYDQVPFQIMAEYGALDVETTYALYNYQVAQFKKRISTKQVNKEEYSFFISNEIEYTRTCFFMEKRGLKVDKDYLNKGIKFYKEKLEGLERAFLDLTGKEFLDDSVFIGDLFRDKYNISLLAELTEEAKEKQRGTVRKKLIRQQERLIVLNDELSAKKNDEKNIKAIKKKIVEQKEKILNTEQELEHMQYKQSYNCSKNNLAVLQHPVADLILDIKSTRKLYSTYFLQIARHIDDNSYLHPSIKQCGADTLRSSTMNPSVQNLPANDIPGYPSIRSCFVSPDGYMLCSTDYQAQELRIALDLAAEHEYINKIMTDKEFDAHSYNANLCGCSRKDCKAVIFGKLFGSGLKHTASQLKKDLQTTKKIVRSVNQLIPRLNNLTYRWGDFAKEHGFTFTAYGNPLKIINHQKFGYKATNYKIQGTASVMTKIAANKWERLAEKVGDGFPILPIHDEILAYFKIGGYCIYPNLTENKTKPVLKDAKMEEFLNCFRTAYKPKNGLTMDAEPEFMFVWRKS